MTPTEALLRRLFDEANRRPTASPGPHVVEDAELLTCWSQGLLVAADHQRLLAHLSECGACCRELATMIRGGEVSLPQPQPEATPRIIVFLRRQMRLPRLAAGGAIAAAIVLFVLFLEPPGTSLERQLARLEQQLQKGDPGAILEPLEQLLAQKLQPEMQQKVADLFEKAGYAESRRRLLDAEYAAVIALEKRLATRDLSSARMHNLRLQAERRIPAEYALAQANMLIHYGYELDGFAPAKGLPTLDKETERIEQVWKQAVERFPDDTELRANFGHFLLMLARFDEAKQQFFEADKRGDPRASVGLGFVAFELGNYREARDHFEKAAEVAPDNAAAHVNEAMVAERLGERAKASAHWNGAATLTTDPQLKRKIHEHLRRPQP